MPPSPPPPPLTDPVVEHSRRSVKPLLREARHFVLLLRLVKGGCLVCGRGTGLRPGGPGPRPGSATVPPGKALPRGASVSSPVRERAILPSPRQLEDLRILFKEELSACGS